MSLARRNGRAQVAFATAPVRCAIYTRKSTDEGLDRDFNSLDNQREAAEAFIVSQRHEGWSALPERYDDGGFSGGNVDRPALKRLLADVDAGLLDTIVVYRLDRLSRSLVDFGRIHEFLEKRGVALVSVTESINTKSPHGRMMVNVLLSFAQYERELVGERTKHKMHAARRRGKWTGGTPILGYDTAPEGGRLVVNRDEAEQVRGIFEMFAGNASLVAIASELNHRGWTRKSWTTRDGRRREGGTWDRLNLRTLLTNPLYAGMQKLRDDTFPGEHPAIVSKALFQRVQRLLDGNRRDHVVSERNRHGALLKGILRCGSCDAPMLFSPTRKAGRLYSYYRCAHAMKSGAAACPTKSVKADVIEAFVIGEVKRLGADPQLQEQTFREAVGQLAAQRRGLKAEAKRIERDIAVARRDTGGLTAAIAKAGGRVEQALLSSLETAQERITTLDTRLAEVRTREAALAAQTVAEADIGRALEAFDPIWEVLLTHERERVLRLLIAGIRYDGSTGKLDIDWRLAGFGELAQEVGGE